MKAVAQRVFSRGNIIKLIAFLVVGAVGFLVYQKIFASPAKPVTATVKRGDLKEELTISGQIDAEEKAVLRFQTSGYLSWVGVKEGDSVKKFQTLASLDQRALQKTLQKYLAAYKKDRNAFDQDKDTYKDQVITDTIKRTIENAQADLNSSVLDVEMQSIANKYAALWTPIPGIVTHLESPNAGVNVTPAQSEIDVVNPKTVYMAALADQTEVTGLLEGQSGKLVLDAYPDKTLLGMIRDIAFIPKTGETGTVYTVKFYFDDDNQNFQYRLGMTGDLTFVTGEAKGALYLPNKFIKTTGGKKYVNGKTKKVYVETGLETDTDTEIKNGLSEGEIVND